MISGVKSIRSNFKFNLKHQKLEKLRKEIDQSGREIDLEIDGGINFENIQSVIDAGANMIVAGTTTFKGGPDEYANNIEKLRGH